MHSICNDCVFFGLFLAYIPYVGYHLIRYFFKRSSGYDCSKCKVWDCDARSCSRTRVRFLSKHRKSL